MKITVISLFRDSASYLETTLANLAALAERHELDFYFYENDSQDETVAQLRGWMAGRPGVLRSETLRTPRYAHTPEPERLRAMASYRNRILADAIGSDSEWTLLLDSDVEFPRPSSTTISPSPMRRS